MRKSIYILISFLAICFYTNAQNTSIIDDLNTAKTGQGKVIVYQDDAIKKLLGTSIQASRAINNAAIMSQLDTDSDGNKTANSTKNTIRAKGYRIQIYSGNDQRRSKGEAQARGNTIRSSFPNMEVSVTYNSPVWRVKAGNFRTREQASQALSEMKMKFPGFGQEMYIINDVIKIRVD